MEITERLSAKNDSRKLIPSKYLWGQFTPDVEGVGFTELPLQERVSDDATIAVDNGGVTLVSMKMKDVIKNASSSSNISKEDVVDFNSYDTVNMYSIVQTTQDVTLNAPQNVTAKWLVQYFKEDTTKVLICTRIDNPSIQLMRCFTGESWTDWNYVYASYSPY